MQNYKTAFLRLALQYQVLRFGSFTLKSGRISPYFFNLGRIASGAALRQLAHAYADAIADHALEFDLLFGPAYKGIPLAAALACALGERGLDLPFAYNRKEAKDHGEGGTLVGAEVAGRRVLIVDDVLTAGTALRESHALLTRAGALPVAAITALDRQERGPGGGIASLEVSEDIGLSMISLVTVQDLLQYLKDGGGDEQVISAIAEYQARYGAAAA
jgi:orotate phosphoribosyltransferase